MKTIKKYLQNTEFAVKSQLDIMKNYEKENFNTLAKLLSKIKTKTIEDMNSFKNEFDSNIYSKNVIAGSILQIAYMNIRLHSNNKVKNTFLQDTEKHVNDNKYKYFSDNEEKDKRFLKKNYKFKFNEKFCVGRDIKDMPIGLIIYAARNQYNHVDERVMELSLDNTLILDYIYKLYPDKVNDFDLNIYDDKNIYKYFSYSILNILGWTYLSSEDPYSIYKKDMEHLF